MKMQFCPYCGTKLDEGAHFCKNCGATINSGTQETISAEKEQPSEGKSTERKTVWDGTIHKCPSCGEVLQSFEVNCPACGYEIRDVKASNSVQDLAQKLDQIEAQQMPAFQGKQSFLKNFIGKDFSKGDDEDKVRSRFNIQKQQRKVDLIINFPVPNTREDILEFMLLASSNIHAKKGADDEVTKAWIAKIDQVYKKAGMAIKNNDDLCQIKRIYQKVLNPIKLKKFAFIMALPLLFSLLMFMGLFEGEYMMFLASLILFAVIIAISVIYVKRLYK